MSNILLNIFTQNLFRTSNYNFIREVDEIILKDSFIQDINDNKLKVEYLHSYSNIQEFIDTYQKAKIRVYSDSSFIYTHKNHSMLFGYDKSNLPTTVGLLNINIVNTYSYYIITIILNYQKVFIKSKRLADIKYIHYDSIINELDFKYNTKIFKSHISNFIKKTFLL